MTKRKERYEPDPPPLEQMSNPVIVRWLDTPEAVYSNRQDETVRRLLEAIHHETKT